MKNYLISIVIFTLGFSLGWLSNNELVSNSSEQQPAASQSNERGFSSRSTTEPSVISLSNLSTPSVNAKPELERATNRSNEALFSKLLDTRRYRDAVTLYQDIDRQSERLREQLKSQLLTHLNQLIIDQRYSDFSELSGLFLAVYYDDLDVLLLLADFNYKTGVFIEAINVYQLAKTYSYTLADQQKLLTQFNTFVKAVDDFYTQKADWFALGNFYYHIGTVGLLSSHHQYRQAIVMHNSGDTLAAIELLQQLTNDSIVGGQAITSLEQLIGEDRRKYRRAVETQFSRLPDAEAIALQRIGNQYLVDIHLNRVDQATLLIDTGASTTILSRKSFNQLTTKKHLRILGQRIFQTANGFTEGTLYRIPQLQLGSHLIEDAQIAVLDFTMRPGVDGLLGMNILGQFRFHIEQESISLLLGR